MARQLYVFGSNGEGQLAIPAADIVDHPVRASDIPPLDDLRMIIGGYNHTLFCTADGQVFGCGDNRKGQLSGDSGITSPTLETCRSLRGGVALVAATCESSAYVTIHGGSSPSWETSTLIQTKGAGQWGELGRGPGVINLEEFKPQQNQFLNALPSAAIGFAAGVWHYVIVLADGSIHGWGKARLGQLGPSLKGKITVPTSIDNIPFKPVKVVCGKDFTYLVSEPSTGEHIVLGKDKFSISSSKPPNVKGWKDIGATWHSIFVLFEDGTLTAWGRNTMWQLIPPNLPPIEKIAVGSEHVLALTNDGRLISWGWGKHGNCGNLVALGEQVKNDMVSGFWNEIDIPGEVEMITAGYCTSFVVTRNE